MTADSDVELRKYALDRAIDANKYDPRATPDNVVPLAIKFENYLKARSR